MLPLLPLYPSWPTSVMVQKTRHMEWILREAVEVELHLNNMHREDSFYLSWAWKPLICGLREQRQSHTEVSALSIGPWKALTTTVLLSSHHYHLPSFLLMPACSFLIDQAQFLPHMLCLAPVPQISPPRTLLYPHSLGSSLQSCRWRQHASPKHWLLPTNPHGDATQKNIRIVTIMKILNLNSGICQAK
jgi:hypothetical protein